MFDQLALVELRRAWGEALCFLRRVRHHAGTKVPALSLLNFKDEPEESLDVRPLARNLNREPGKKLRDLSPEMLLKASMVVNCWKDFCRPNRKLADYGGGVS